MEFSDIVGLMRQDLEAAGIEPNKYLSPGLLILEGENSGGEAVAWCPDCVAYTAQNYFSHPIHKVVCLKCCQTTRVFTSSPSGTFVS